MKDFQILKYVRKILPLILVFCLLATFVVYSKLDSSNTYTASEVIHYNDEQAELGYAPTGEELDVNEIKSSAVLSKVVDRLGLAGTYSVDTLISRMSITPVPDADKLAQKEAKLEEGEELIYEPSTFIVSFTAKSYEGEEFARTVLDEILDVYFAEYSRKYVNMEPANNVIENLNNDNYDYIEVLELIDSSIDDTLKVLYQRMEQNPHFRSTQTGVSNDDLVEEFYYLRQVKVSELFSKVYKYQVTKNKEILVSDYTTRIDNNDIANVKEESLIEDVVIVIDAYVEKMRESGNTNISYEYILDDVHEKNLIDQNFVSDQTVTYDELIYGWRDHNEYKEHSIIDSAYCEYVIDTFEKCSGKCENEECKSSALTCTEIHNKNYDKIRMEIDAEIESLLEDLTELYRITKETNDEYNEYIGAKYISVLSTASVKESINVTLYTLLAFAFLVIGCCGGTVLIVRLADIIGYVFYRDHLTGFNNRAFFDKYIKSHNKKNPGKGEVYCVFDIDNFDVINTESEFKVSDEIVKLFAKRIKDVFGKIDATYIYNGNGSFVVFAKKTDAQTVNEIVELFKLSLDEREDYTDVKIEYKVGVAAAEDGIKSVRKLLTEAVKDKKLFVSDICK
mgnify:CR=1 FL=1